MKPLLSTILVAALMVGAPAFSPTSVATASARSPLFGHWAVDVSRLPIPPAARPKGVTIAFSDAGSGKWTTRVEIVDAAGAQTWVETTHDLEGTATTGKGTITEADVVGVRMPAPNVLVMALGKDKLPASTRIYAVGTDNDRMTETVVYHWENGIPMTRVNYFSRVR
jgi:hypothetical protein